MPDSPHPVYRIPDNANKRKQQRIIIFLLIIPPKLFRGEFSRSEFPRFDITCSSITDVTMRMLGVLRRRGELVPDIDLVTVIKQNRLI